MPKMPVPYGPKQPSRQRNVGLLIRSSLFGKAKRMTFPGVLSFGSSIRNRIQGRVHISKHWRQQALAIPYSFSSKLAATTRRTPILHLCPRTILSQHRRNKHCLQGCIHQECTIGGAPGFLVREVERTLRVQPESCQRDLQVGRDGDVGEWPGFAVKYVLNGTCRASLCGVDPGLGRITNFGDCQHTLELRRCRDGRDDAHNLST
ncbi:hypothetical protein M427DRAFT_389086 [Gonapodya prolifera JEL478]|uniref:Uncharacterized protein n=1 Tax=Gonapodya prolifera (strain JEL478) TaxID=1344416 RepID=A0A139A7Z5_GONPJ|nr:hypothetical protein M427DRAFT_389086 [Gonapodya prolifera JEL478]|eukprot:KXS12819.1 hypothetical protein M427DRAFT_389086 [Gonapodya prolifera JEL478]